MSSIPTGQYVNLGHVVVRWKNQDRNVARWRNEERKCPYLDSSVISGRCNPLAIRTESEAVDRQTMSFVGEDASLPADIPQLSIKKFKKLVNSCGIFQELSQTTTSKDSGTIFLKNVELTLMLVSADPVARKSPYG